MIKDGSAHDSPIEGEDIASMPMEEPIGSKISLTSLFGGS
jgi:hypothetical protein